MSEVEYKRRATDNLNAPTRRIPDNDHDMMLQMWHAIIGTNGTGLIKKHEELHKNVCELKKEVITKSEFPDLLIKQNKLLQKAKLSKAKSAALFIIALIGGASTTYGLILVFGGG